jgi:hypothetical protein
LKVVRGFGVIMTLCQLVKAIDDFNGKFSIGGVGDVFFLYGGVNQYARLLGLKATLILKKNYRLSIRHFRPVKKRAKAKNGCVPRKYKIKSRKSEGFLGCSI